MRAALRQLFLTAHCALRMSMFNLDDELTQPAADSADESADNQSLPAEEQTAGDVPEAEVGGETV